MMKHTSGFMGLAAFLLVAICCSMAGAEEDLRSRAIDAMQRATRYFSGQLAVRGGYVYYYDLELQQRWGEGLATDDQIWVQPPGTPTVGLAFVEAWKATGDDLHQEAARAAAAALLFGQLRSGGWTNCIDFDSQGSRVAQYRGGARSGKNYSSLDDDQSTAALRFLMQLDQALEFRDQDLHQATQYALDCLLEAQYPCGGFPQVWDGQFSQVPPACKAASYPAYDWRTENRIKEYWHLYTLNDDIALHVANTLVQANSIYADPKFLEALSALGDFLIDAQMPQPQPAWAQQYNFQMHPSWARAFEPPAIASHESQGVIEALMLIFEQTKIEKYLHPIPAALDYLRQSQLSSGQLARFYELGSNRPLYMQRSDGSYELTYDDTRLPTHYGWKTASRVDALQQRYDRLRKRLEMPSAVEISDGQVRRILDSLDEQGRWMSIYDGQRLVGQPKFRLGQQFVSSAVFSRNLRTLASYVANRKE